jgi:hypothetical protein
MVEFSTIVYHLGRLGRFVVIWSSNNFAQPPLFFQVFRHSLRKKNITTAQVFEALKKVKHDSQDNDGTKKEE